MNTLTRLLIALFVLCGSLLIADHPDALSHDAGQVKFENRIKRDRLYWQKVSWTFGDLNAKVQFPGKAFPIDTDKFMITYIGGWTYYQFSTFAHAHKDAWLHAMELEEDPQIYAEILKDPPECCAYAVSFERYEDGILVGKGRDYIVGELRLRFLIEGDDFSLASIFFENLEITNR